MELMISTARGGDEAKVGGLLAGADDYVAKPFNARELIARGTSLVQITLTTSTHAITNR